MTGTEIVELVVTEPWRLQPHRFAEYASGREWHAWPHLRLISERIQRAVIAGNGRILINLPPGHGKSSLVSHWTPTWFLDNWPEQRVIVASHGAALAAQWGRIVRNEFEQNPKLTTKLAPDSTAADRWNTPQGGGMVTVGVGGGITGFRGDLILVDDPHPSWEEAMSATHRTRVAEWFDGTLYDRGEPNATIVVLMHRWHEGDLSGHLMEQHGDEWDTISLPALAEPGDPLNREPGEALCPERYDADALADVRRAVGDLVFDAKYQQKPRGVGSGRVYDRFEPASHENKSLTLTPGLPLDISFDFNRNPGMHVELGQYDPKRDLFTVVHEVHGPMMKLDRALVAVEKLIESLGISFPVYRIFGDATGTQDRAETTETAYQQIKNWLAKKSWKVQFVVPASNPPVRDRIDTFNEALRDTDGDAHFTMHPLNCPRLLDDLKHLKADEQGLIDKRDQKLSHASDAAGYWIHQLRPIRRQSFKFDPKDFLTTR